MRLSFLLLAVCAILASFVVWPELDLAVSALFAEGVQGFYLRHNPVLLGFEETAFWGARGLALFFFLCGVTATVRHRVVFWFSGKKWFFLLLALLIGPGLVANIVFKDHWGRARPRQVEVFGGVKQFTPALFMTDQCHRNCSFVSGDAAFGFYLTAFAFVVPFAGARRAFWTGMGLGVLFGGARLLLGAHFLSDILFAAIIVLLSNAGLAVLFFGVADTRKRIRLAVAD